MTSVVRQMLDWCDQKDSRYFTRRDVARATGLEGDRLDGFFAVDGGNAVEPCGGAWWRFKEDWLAVYRGDKLPHVIQFYAYEEVGIASVNMQAIAKADFNMGEPMYLDATGNLQLEPQT